MTKTQTFTDITKLSDLAQLAVEDARKLDRKTYWPDAGRWHEPRLKDEQVLYHVCLGGAVIAGHGLAKDDEDTTPGLVAQRLAKGVMTTDNAIYHRLVALDSVRQGLYHSAERAMHDNPSVALDSRLDEALHDIRQPRYAKFCNWDEFGQFLDDLEQRVIPALRAAGI